MVYGGVFHQGYGQFPVASLRSRSNVARKVAVPYLLSTEDLLMRNGLNRVYNGATINVDAADRYSAIIEQ